MPEPLVSVILPTYNRAALLTEALASVRAQTFTDWECVVVDDGSTDGTPGLLAGVTDPRVRCVRVAHSGNPAVARNAGLAAARGTLVAFLDDDDLWKPEKLAVQVPLMRSGRYEWSYTGFVSVDAGGRPFWETPPERIRSGLILRPLLQLRAAVALPTVLARRAFVLDAGGFDETLPTREDYALWLVLAERAEVVATPEPLTVVRDHPGRIFRPEGYRFGLELYRRWRDRVTDPALRAVCRRQIADTHIREARRLIAARRWPPAVLAALGAIGADPRGTLHQMARAAARRVRTRPEPRRPAPHAPPRPASVTDADAPPVSVVVPTHDRCDMLREALESVRRQSDERWELVVVDDGSTDGTAAALAALDEPRLRVIRLEHSGNVARVRNAGLAAARGAYVAFLDDDDRWMPAKLAVQLAGLRASGCRWGYTAFDRMDEQGRPLHDPRVAPWRAHHGWILEELLAVDAIVPLPTVMAERALLEEVGGFDEAFAFCEDYELWFRLAARAAVHVEQTPLASVRVHARNQQADRAGVHAAWVRVYGKTGRSLADPWLAGLCRRKAGEHAVALARLSAAAGRRRTALAALAGPGLRAVAQPDWWRALVRSVLPGRLVDSVRATLRR
jgi:glycosyltransferase involved in cell wall biosynthesis